MKTALEQQIERASECIAHYAIGFDGYNADTTGDVSATLGVNCGMSTGRNGVIEQETYTLEPGIAAREGGHIYEGVSGTLRANAGDNQMSVCYAVENHPNDSRVKICEDGKCQTLSQRMGTGGGNVPLVLESQNYIQIEMEVATRKYEVDTEKLKKVLSESKKQSELTNKQIAEKLALPTTQVEHWFRKDKCFSIPEPCVWYDLKSLLNIETDEFDKPITEFEFKGNCYDLSNRIYIGDKAPTLTTQSKDYMYCIPLIKEEPIICLQGSMIGRQEQNGPQGDGINEDVSFTLNTADRHAVCYSLDSLNSNSMKSSNPHSGCREVDTAKTIDTSNQDPSKNQGGIAICATTGSFMQVNEDKSPTLAARDFKDPNIVCYANQAYGKWKESDKSSVQRASGGDYGGGSETLVVERPQYIVRRLTPLECCRLQGFPDTWEQDLATDEPTEEDLIFWREVFETHRKIVTGASKGRSDKQIIKWLKNPYSDSASYKMWGNGIALPNAAFVLKGIAEVLNGRTVTIKSHVEKGTSYE